MPLLYGLQNLSLNLGGNFMAILKIFDGKYLNLLEKIEMKV
jgi:hypothetical protein